MRVRPHPKGGLPAPLEWFKFASLSTESEGLAMRITLDQAIAALEAAETLRSQFNELMALKQRIAAHPPRALRRHRRKLARGRIARP